MKMIMKMQALMLFGSFQCAVVFCVVHLITNLYKITV